MSWSGDASELDLTQGTAAGSRRSRSGCTLCRARKVKCDEKWPTCGNCERLKLECPGPPGPGSSSHPRQRRRAEHNTGLTQAGTLRQRVAKSCPPCRAAKARCSGGDICTRCSRKGLDCSSLSLSHRTKPDRNRVPSQQNDLVDTSTTRRISNNSLSTPPLSSTLQGYPSSLSWLYEPELPTGERLLILVEEYFAHIHPLRCNGFVHKPSFMQRLDEDGETCRKNESLLHVICALGAKLYALNNTFQLPPDSVLTAGNQWAKVAKARIFIDLDDLSIEKLMTAILLYDHDLRIGSYASAFMLSGMTARMSQALQLNLENSADVLCTKLDSSAIENEARRRLMWSCYLLDSWVGSGVNQLTLLEDRDLKIQLPCHSHNFSLGIPCVTETLDEAKVLSFISNEQIPNDPCQNMGIEAYFIRLVSVRKKVLRYVKQLSTAKPPWQDDSEFFSLVTEFEAWRRSLPLSLLWNAGAIYARKESSQLGALTLLWCTYHQTLVDLYRIGMPTLFRIQKDITFPPEQQEFLDHCRKVCFSNAHHVSNIISEALRHGLKILADTWFCIIAHDSTKVMLYYLKLNKGSIVRLDATEVNATVSLVHQNLESLLQMRSMVATAEHCSVSVVKMMAAAGIQPRSIFPHTEDERPRESGEGSPSPGAPAQESPENVLNPLAIYRMARTALHDKDTQSISSNSPSMNTAFSPRSISHSGVSQHHQHLGAEATARVDQRDPGNFNSFHSSQGTTHIDHFYSQSGQTRDDASMTLNNIGLLPTNGMLGPWDTTDLAVMDMLDGGISPWTADYLTDGQSGVDPFLFPF